MKHLTACLPSYSTMIIYCFYILFLFSSCIFHCFLSLFFFHLLLFQCYGYRYDTLIPNMRPSIIIGRIMLQFSNWHSIRSKHSISLQKKFKLITLLKSKLKKDQQDLKACFRMVYFCILYLYHLVSYSYAEELSLVSTVL